MAVTAETKSDAEHMALLERLFEERGIHRYGLFLLTSEGLFTPDGYEEMSGYVVSGDLPVIFFWTGWDETARRTCFEIWQVAEPQPDWQDDTEYQAARVAAGLT